MIEFITALLLILTAGMLAVIVWQAIQNKRQPIRRVRAVVLRRRSIDYSLDAPANPIPFFINLARWGIGRRSQRISVKDTARLSGEVTLVSSTDCFVTFGAEGQEIELIVPESVFMNIPDGTAGTLIYQGEIFKHFLLDPAVPNDYKKQGPKYPPGRPLIS